MGIKITLETLSDLYASLENRVGALEVASRQEQPLVRQPGTAEENSPRSPDRELLAKFWICCINQRRMIETAGLVGEYWRGRKEVCDVFLQCLESVDLGDVHSSQPKTNSPKKTKRVTPKKAKK